MEGPTEKEKLIVALKVSGLRAQRCAHKPLCYKE